MPAVTACAAILLLACSDGAAPEESVTVHLLMQSTEAPVTSEVPSIRCTGYLIANTIGSAPAFWRSGMVKFRGGRNDDISFLDRTMSESQITQMFGSPSVDGADTVYGFEMFAPAPFLAQFDFIYRAGANGSDRTATAEYRCGAKPSGAPPSISEITITPSSGLIDQGDSIQVVIKASTPAGEWKSSWRVASPCGGDFVGSFHSPTTKVMERSLWLRIPTVCGIGTHINTAFEMTLVDAGLLQTSAAASFNADITDRIPPRITVDSLTGDYFDGDTLRYRQWAYDNGTLRKVHWEVLGSSTIDSSIATSTFGLEALNELRIPILSEWGSPFRLRLSAEDAAGNTGEKVSPVGGMRLHPRVARQASTVEIPGLPFDFAVDDTHGLLYIRRGTESDLAIVSMSPLQLVATQSMPNRISSYDLTQSGDTLFALILNTRQVAIWEASKPGRPVTLRDLPTVNGASYRTETLRITAHGHLVTNVVFESGQRGVLDIDIASWTATRVDAPDPLSGPEILLERSGDGTALFFRREHQALVYVVGATTLTRGPATSVSGDPELVSVDDAGQRFAIGLDVYDVMGQKLSRSPSIVNPGVAPVTRLSPDGATLWQFSGGSAVRTRASDGRILDKSRGIGAGRNRFTRDGSRLITIQGNQSNGTTIAIIDAR